MKEDEVLVIRRFITRFFPGLAARMEQDSRKWMVQCPKCGHEISVWDAGGIRYRARGTVRRLGRCSQCQKLRMLRIYLPEKD